MWDSEEMSYAAKNFHKGFDVFYLWPILVSISQFILVKGISTSFSSLVSVTPSYLHPWREQS